MYREIAVTTLIAAPLLASAAAHFAPRGGAQRNAQAEVAAPRDSDIARTDMTSGDMMAVNMPPPPSPPSPAASEPPAFDGAPSLDPVASVDPDAVAATRSGTMLPDQTPATAPREVPEEEAQGPSPAQRY